MLDWIIVGAGIHGTHLAHLLLRHAGIRADDLRLIDPHAEPLTAWHRRAAATGMQSLRSPVAHHLARPARSLLDYAQQQNLSAHLHGHYRRPGLDLFNAHSEEVIEASDLRRCHIQDSVISIQAEHSGYRVIGQHGQWRTRHVLLALGPAAPYRPPGLTQIEHVFDPQFNAAALPTHQTVGIIGGGLTAAQLALSLVARGGQPVLVTRRPLRIQAFDSDPCYLGPKCLGPFARTQSLHKRRALIRAARQTGTVPEQVYTQLMAAQKNKRLALVTGEAKDLSAQTLLLTDGQKIAMPQALLATGFSEAAPGGQLVQNLIQTLDLPHSRQGLPVTNAQLEWRAGLFVSGRLAELSLGPAAGNIAGARLAGRRLLGSVNKV